jgi:hypothetical protein
LYEVKIHHPAYNIALHALYRAGTISLEDVGEYSTKMLMLVAVISGLFGSLIDVIKRKSFLSIG